jgi:major inositol transporter-like SP family MFS transporter
LSLSPEQGGLGLSVAEEGVVTASLVFGSVFGSILGGRLSDRQGLSMYRPIVSSW